MEDLEGLAGVALSEGDDRAVVEDGDAEVARHDRAGPLQRQLAEVGVGEIAAIIANSDEYIGYDSACQHIVAVEHQVMSGNCRRHVITGFAYKLYRVGSGDVFEYDAQWLSGANAMLLDPELQLFQGPQYSNDNDRSNFGVFLDSSPDRWGQLLMKRREAREARHGDDGVHDEPYTPTPR